MGRVWAGGLVSEGQWMGHQFVARASTCQPSGPWTRAGVSAHSGPALWGGPTEPALQPPLVWMHKRRPSVGVGLPRSPCQLALSQV